MTFTDLNSELRTDESYENQTQPMHHIGRSPLQLIGTRMISQFRLDPMHLVYLGVFRRLLFVWLKWNGLFHLHWTVVEAIDGVLNALEPSCPSDFNRPPRSLNDIKMFRAHEFRRLLHYDSILIFRDNLDENVYRHFLLLYTALYILASPIHVTSAEMRNFAKNLLVNFVQHSVVIYGQAFVVYNVHALIHLVQECEDHGVVDAFSAFPYENALMLLKRNLKSFYKPLQQAAFRIIERSNVPTTISLPPDDIEVVLSMQYENPDVPGIHFKKMSIGKTVFHLNDRDICFSTTNGQVVVLQDIFQNCNGLVQLFVVVKFLPDGDNSDDEDVNYDIGLSSWISAQNIEFGTIYWPPSGTLSTQPVMHVLMHFFPYTRANSSGKSTQSTKGKDIIKKAQCSKNAESISQGNLNSRETFQKKLEKARSGVGSQKENSENSPGQEESNTTQVDTAGSHHSPGGEGSQFAPHSSKAAGPSSSRESLMRKLDQIQFEADAKKGSGSSAALSKSGSDSSHAASPVELSCSSSRDLLQEKLNQLRQKGGSLGKEKPANQTRSGANESNAASPVQPSSSSSRDLLQEKLNQLRQKSGSLRKEKPATQTRHFKNISGITDSPSPTDPKFSERGNSPVSPCHSLSLSADTFNTIDHQPCQLMNTGGTSPSLDDSLSDYLKNSGDSNEEYSSISGSPIHSRPTSGLSLDSGILVSRDTGHSPDHDGVPSSGTSLSLSRLHEGSASVSTHVSQRSKSPSNFGIGPSSSRNVTSMEDRLAYMESDIVHIKQTLKDSHSKLSELSINMARVIRALKPAALAVIFKGSQLIEAQKGIKAWLKDAPNRTGGFKLSSSSS
ncbi:hypothetical protein FOCC_FOCC006459 [Frankliniella occidentalis]|nr:hypothetical protein FOCC_FOCC006459 [Frankliniella occidentalis]